jgi:uncharacterized protein
MLIEFRVTNFRSFRDTQVFSMVASADQSLPDNTIETPVMGKQRLLRSAAMYGPNASGKSNLIKAMDFVQDFVTGSTDRKPGSGTGVQPFALDEDSINRPSEFEITFIHEDVRYQYGFSVDRERILAEWLIAYPIGVRQIWYERSIDSKTGETEWYFGPRYTGERQRLTKLTRVDVPFLTVAATFNHERLSSVYEWFTIGFRTIDATTNGSWLEQLTGILITDNEAFVQQTEAMLREADTGIRTFSLEQRKWKDDDFPTDMPDALRNVLRLNPRIDIQLYHEAQDGDLAIAIPFDEESIGTRRFFSLIGPWLTVLSRGACLVLDELDASLHPTLVRTLVQMFHDPKINTKGAQLIFNTHDVTLLDTGLFRRDQFWFVEKDRSGASNIYSLLEYSPRKDEALQRGYLQGRYGAIPSTSELLNLDVTRG